jgi:leucyl aminopeptidase (aminopeptidase T)
MPSPPRRSSTTFHAPKTELHPRVDAALAVAARRVIEGSLSIVPGERLVLVMDESTREIGTALVEVATLAGAETSIFVLEQLGPRPHTQLHPEVAEALTKAQASILLTRFEDGELGARSQLVDRAAQLRLRHAHLIGVSARSLIAGMAVDPRRIADVARALRFRLRPTSSIKVKSSSGTDLLVRCEARHRWVEYSGVISPGTKANLPAGLAGLLTRSPLRLEFSGSVLRKIEGRDLATIKRIETMVRRVPQLERVGLVSFGTNVGMSDVVGDIFTDQKLPSFHLSLGITFPEKTGARWTAPSWIAFTQVGSEIDLDGVPAMRGGRYLFS